MHTAFIVTVPEWESDKPRRTHILGVYSDPQVACSKAGEWASLCVRGEKDSDFPFTEEVNRAFPNLPMEGLLHAADFGFARVLEYPIE